MSFLISSDFLELEAPAQRRMKLTDFLIMLWGEDELLRKIKLLRSCHRTQLMVGKHTLHKRRVEAWTVGSEQRSRHLDVLAGREAMPNLRRKGDQIT